MNGVSKKLCMTAAAILAITKFAEGDGEKWPYAIIIAAICVTYELIQGFLDWKNSKKMD